jgi:hypothetical protein
MLKYLTLNNMFLGAKSNSPQKFQVFFWGGGGCLIPIQCLGGKKLKEENLYKYMVHGNSSLLCN